MAISTVIPPQVRAARALLDWTQSKLAERAGVAVTTVRDMEEGKRADTAAAGNVIQTLENEGVEFVAGNEKTGPGVRLAIAQGPNVVRRPNAMTMWEGVPVDMEYQGKRFTAFIAREVLEDLSKTPGDVKLTDAQYLAIFNTYERKIVEAVKIAFERGASWSRDGRSLYVRPLDVKELVPPDAWGKLIMANGMIMNGTPVFAGTRVPIKMVLELLDSGVDREELDQSYPFLRDQHIEEAREYLRNYPAKPRASTGSSAPWKLKSKRVVKKRPRA